MGIFHLSFCRARHMHDVSISFQVLPRLLEGSGPISSRRLTLHSEHRWDCWMVSSSDLGLPCRSMSHTTLSWTSSSEIELVILNGSSISVHISTGSYYDEVSSKTTSWGDLDWHVKVLKHLYFFCSNNKQRSNCPTLGPAFCTACPECAHMQSCRKLSGVTGPAWFRNNCHEGQCVNALSHAVVIEICARFYYFFPEDIEHVLFLQHYLAIFRIKWFFISLTLFLSCE